MNPVKEASLADAVTHYTKGRFNEAFVLFEALAHDGDQHAQAWLAALYANGEGVPADLPRAIEWYKRAAIQGHTQAQTNLGAMMLSAHEALRNEVEACAGSRLRPRTGTLRAGESRGPLYKGARRGPGRCRCGELVPAGGGARALPFAGAIGFQLRDRTRCGTRPGAGVRVAVACRAARCRHRTQCT